MKEGELKPNQLLMGGTGLEPPNAAHCKSSAYENKPDGAQSNAHPLATIPELDRVVEVWPKLTKDQQVAIIQIIERRKL